MPLRHASGAAYAAAALLLGTVLLGFAGPPLLAQQSVDPPAQNPVPPAAPLPAAPPAPPDGVPPAQEPLDGERNPPAESRDLAPREVVPDPQSGPPEKEETVEPAEAISAAPLQEVPEPWLPEMDVERHHLEGYRAAARGENETALAHYEAALAGEPDNLRWGTEYRQVVIAAGQYDRGLRFFGRLAKRHPQAANLHLNYAYAFVDKVPVEGPLGQMNLASGAVRELGASIALEESWLAYYSRGSCYLYWPPLFGRATLGIADLERAIDLAKAEPRRSYHARAWAALGDGFWRLGKRDAMRDAWRRGLELFPASAELEVRLALPDAELDAHLVGVYQLGRRIDTRLEEIWQAMREEAP